MSGAAKTPACHVTSQRRPLPQSGSKDNRLTWPEIAGFAGSLLAIVVIFVSELRRARGTGSATLSPGMLMFLRITLGVVFAILGVIGSVLPIMQGWMFFLLSFLVLFPNSQYAVKALDKIQPRMPRMVAWLRRRGIGCPREGDTIRAR